MKFYRLPEAPVSQEKAHLLFLLLMLEEGLHPIKIKEALVIKPLRSRRHFSCELRAVNLRSTQRAPSSFSPMESSWTLKKKIWLHTCAVHNPSTIPMAFLRLSEKLMVQVPPSTDQTKAAKPENCTTLASSHMNSVWLLIMRVRSKATVTSQLKR